MGQDKIIETPCGHDGVCGCRHADVFMAEPAAAYNASRRIFFRNLLRGGVTVAVLPLLEEQAQADLFTPSVADQKKLGQQAAQQIFQKYREVKDSRASHFRQVGARLVNALNTRDRTTWDYSFHVIDSKDVNAFAVPGGNMFMFTGLLDRITTDDELAAVTGHEMTHVRLQHWAKAAANQTKRQLGLSVLLGLAHAGAGWQTLVGGLNSLYTLRFSRGEEDQADAGGLQDMVAAGYNPQGMLDLFHVLQKAEGSGGGPPEFLSDHPLTTQRIRHTEQRIAQLRGHG